MRVCLCVRWGSATTTASMAVRGNSIDVMYRLFDKQFEFISHIIALQRCHRHVSRCDWHLASKRKYGVRVWKSNEFSNESFFIELGMCARNVQVLLVIFHPIQPTNIVRLVENALP